MTGEPLTQSTAIGLVKKYIAVTMAALLPSLYLAYSHLPVDLPVMETPADRMVFAVKWSFLPFLMLVGDIQRVANTRADKAWNPTDEKTAAHTDIPNRCSLIGPKIRIF